MYNHTSQILKQPRLFFTSFYQHLTCQNWVSRYYRQAKKYLKEGLEYILICVWKNIFLHKSAQEQKWIEFHISQQSLTKYAPFLLSLFGFSFSKKRIYSSYWSYLRIHILFAPENPLQPNLNPSLISLCALLLFSVSNPTSNNFIHIFLFGLPIYISLYNFFCAILKCSLGSCFCWIDFYIFFSLCFFFFGNILSWEV